MIAAHHTAWADWIFEPYLTWLCKRHFHAMHLLGGVPNLEPQLPLLLLANHSTWWDGFFIYLLNKKIFHRRAFLMMLEVQLRRYAFFRYLGAFSVEPSSPASVRTAIRHAVEILAQHPPPLLCLFPQGELLPWSQRPLVYKRGCQVILHAYGGKANLLPLAIRAEYRGQQLPEAFFLFGENKIVERETIIPAAQLAQQEDKLLENLSQRMRSGEPGMELLQSKRLF